MNQLKQVHAFSLRNGTDHTSVLILKCLEVPDVAYAHKLFDLIPQPTVFLCNKLIQAYSSRGPHRQCFSLYAQMRRRGCVPNHQSFTFLFGACASLCSPPLAQLLHAHFIRSGCGFDVYALTALVDMYAKLGSVESARKQFDQIQFKDVPTWNSMVAGYARCGNMVEAKVLFQLMPWRNLISWTIMISGYSQNGQYLNALKLFLLMEKETELKPNEVTLASVLPACAHLGALEIGQRICAYASQNGYLDNMFVTNALIEFYAKCGRLDAARQLFDGLGSRKNLCSWNSMIMGLAIHGRSQEALKLFDELLQEGRTPDDITYVGILVACVHGGMVIRGQELFDSMETSFNIIPKIEHYGCMVDLLGRAGKVEEAYDLTQKMPMKPDSVIWGAILGACSFRPNVEVAEKAAESLFELEPWNPGNYVILSNIYASARRWDGVAKLRKTMKGGHITKAAGYSFIEEGGEVHKFVVEDKSHPRCDEIYALLRDLLAKMKSIKHEADVGSLMTL